MTPDRRTVLQWHARLADSRHTARANVQVEDRVSLPTSTDRTWAEGHGEGDERYRR